jgi:hypothetical protein
MSSLDLINLGFYTESFINLFSLVDDLTQETIKAGLTSRGLAIKEQTQLLRAIKEERLKLYLCNLSKLCGWNSLEEENDALFQRVLKVNTLRNNIMHGSRRLQRSETIEASNSLLSLIDWLRTNPFGFLIPDFPLLKVAEANFLILPSKPDEKQSSDGPSN